MREPSGSSDPVRLLAAGRADFAVLDIHDLALARERGRDLVGVLALVQRPLAAVLAQPDVSGPAALQGRTVGVTGLPSDDAVLRSMVAGDGGDPRRVRRVTIGFNAVGSLLSRRVAGATAFWNVEGVALRRRRAGFSEFRVDAYGAPAYPELVVCVRRQHPARARPVLVRGPARRAAPRLRLHPAAPGRPASTTWWRRSPGLNRALAADQLATLRPALTHRGRFGVLDGARLRAWAAWEARMRHRAPPARRGAGVRARPARLGPHRRGLEAPRAHSLLDRPDRRLQPP